MAVHHRHRPSPCQHPKFRDGSGGLRIRTCTRRQRPFCLATVGERNRSIPPQRCRCDAACGRTAQAANPHLSARPPPASSGWLARAGPCGPAHRRLALVQVFARLSHARAGKERERRPGGLGGASAGAILTRSHCAPLVLRARSHRAASFSSLKTALGGRAGERVCVKGRSSMVVVVWPRGSADGRKDRPRAMADGLFVVVASDKSKNLHEHTRAAAHEQQNYTPVFAFPRGEIAAAPRRRQHVSVR